MITLYTKKNCPLCEEAAQLLELLNTEAVPVKEIDIYQSDVLLEKYQLTIPVICYKDKKLYGNQISVENIDTLLHR